ncbi:ASCH domain-containing protein [Enterococcus sp. DIV1298c]|uniref:ASCH domain-containing protein n=1 Tax=Candidatus Enterococcus mangumiae TaxID=2230878 RepID=A0ABZ2SZC0_9ENTE|nr:MULTISPECIES: ASCH domain-containing protein [unclassified Enterococcus]MBO0462786.1 ASCH domain-containing protein [Enterococcus sp. DIV1298c]MBO0490573.1 ASCH domain-containing protein [Enterococcus sp. DIV1094]
MNEQAKKYWEEFWQGETPPTHVTAEQWGWEGTPMADELAALILKGIKTASCSSYDECLYYGEDPLSKIGSYTIVLNRKDEPVGIIKYTDMTIMPMNEVTEEIARAEGEGDLSYDYWYQVHKKFFKELMPQIGKEFYEEMPLAVERFELIDARKYK